MDFSIFSTEVCEKKYSHLIYWDFRIFCCQELHQMSRVIREYVFGVSKQVLQLAVQLQKVVRGLKFGIQEVAGLYCL